MPGVPSRWNRSNRFHRQSKFRLQWKSLWPRVAVAAVDAVGVAEKPPQPCWSSISAADCESDCGKDLLAFVRGKAASCRRPLSTTSAAAADEATSVEDTRQRPRAEGRRSGLSRDSGSLAASAAEDPTPPGSSGSRDLQVLFRPLLK